MRVLGLLMTVFGFVFITSLAYASEPQNLVIEMLNKRDDGQKMVYSMDVAEIEVGDTITWVPTSKGHNVETVSYTHLTLPTKRIV